MNDTRSMTRARRFSARIAVVLCLLLAVGMLPMAAFGASKTVSDVEASYLNSATIHMTTTGATSTEFKLDGGAWGVDTSATTSIYGPHVLYFKSTVGDGTVETETLAPFFVDEDVLPTVVTDCQTFYTTPATIEITAADNFNGSGIDFLCYRVDGGQIITAMAPARLAANKAFVAKLAAVTASGISVASAVDPDLAPPHAIYGACATCHEIIIPTPDPTSTPDPTGTPAPAAGGVSCKVAVTSAGAHTIEYWAQDVARNVTAPVTKTFTIAAPVVVKTATSLTMSISKNHAKLRVGYVLSGSISPAFAGAPIVITYRRPGSRTWRTWTTVQTNAAGKFSIGTRAYHLGTYTYRVTFPGDATHGVARYVYDSIHIIR